MKRFFFGDEGSENLVRSIVALALTVGGAWGVMRYQVQDLREDARVCQTNRQHVGERLGSIEGKLDIIIQRLK